ncbi:MAG TPA: hypothetical protein VGR74_16100, partial [Actinomycetota bacterium]|nr:hypothetical protein [Actinomycetota bacterium]
LASDINSGLWVFRVHLDRAPAPSQGAAAGQPATPTAADRQPAAGPSLLTWLAAVAVALGLLVAALAAHRARHGRRVG